MQTAVRPESIADPAERQAHELAEIHALFSSILEEIAGEPLPGTPEAPSPEARISLLRPTVVVLDLAISPSMLRNAMKNSTLNPAAEALLRYFVRKGRLTESDRDKIDFVVTFLYRNRKSLAGHDDPSWDDALMFEKEVASLLPAPAPPLSEEHEHLLRQFESFRSEAHRFRHFDEITDSGIVHRVRSMKACFGADFYHPRVLAAVATYNVFFRERFDELFRKAAAEIRQFASSVLRDPAGVIAPSARSAAVTDLSEAEEAQILEREYGRAQEELRKVSHLRKVAGKQRSERPTTSPQGWQDRQEEERIRSLQEMICTYLQAAGDKPSFTVPLPFGSFHLTSAEFAAFRADYTQEKSFRADFAAAIRRAAVLRARMTAELLEYSANRGAAYRWKPHADSLTFLLKSAEGLLNESSGLLAVIEQRGLSGKRQVLQGNLESLRLHMQGVARALQDVP